MSLYSRVKYSKTSQIVVHTAEEEKALGQGWFDHPKDALAGRVLTNVERGNDAFDPQAQEIAKTEVLTPEAKPVPEAKEKLTAGKSNPK